MAKKEIKKYLIWASLFLVIYFGYLIVKPFFPALITSLILAYLFYPVYMRLNKITPYKIFNAAITVVLILLVIIIPLTLVASNIISESINVYRSGVLEAGISSLSAYQNIEPFGSMTSKASEKVLLYISDLASDFLRKLPSKLIDFLIIIYSTFTFFLSGEVLLKKAKGFIPIANKDELISHIGNTTYAIVYGMFFTAIVLFLISLVGFKILHISPSVILALLVALLVFIPFLGSSIVWVPLAVINAVRGNMFTVVGLVVLGLILALTETLLRAKLIGDRAKIHPLIVIIGIAGGVKLLGVIGLGAGPVFLSALFIIIKEYYT